MSILSFKVEYEFHGCVQAKTCTPPSPPPPRPLQPHMGLRDRAGGATAQGLGVGGRWGSGWEQNSHSHPHSQHQTPPHPPPPTYTRTAQYHLSGLAPGRAAGTTAEGEDGMGRGVGTLVSPRIPQAPGPSLVKFRNPYGCLRLSQNVKNPCVTKLSHFQSKSTETMKTYKN